MHIGKVLGESVGAIVVSVLVTAAAIAATNALDLPSDSWLPQTAMATLVVIVVALALAAAALPATPTPVRWVAGTAGPAGATAIHLGFLLGGTPNYLNGLGGDQLNRVAYLGRFASSPHLADAFYQDLAPFYPAGWFWIGGRAAALAEIPAWEFYKPFAIFTMALAAALAFVAWRRLAGDRMAIPLALVTAGIGVSLAAYEPYSWLFVALLPALALWAQRLDRPGYWLACTLYLGLAAVSYTLIAGIAAVVTCAGAIGAVLKQRSVARHFGTPVPRRAMLRTGIALLAAAAGSALIAAGFWLPYLMSYLDGEPHEASVATDFAPESAAAWPLPMLQLGQPSGLLSLVGLVWLGAVLSRRLGAGDHMRRRLQVTSARGALYPPTQRDIAVALATLAALGYVWFALSGLRALLESTLLAFRLTPAITLAFALAGVFGLRALWQLVGDRIGDLTPPAERTHRARQVQVVGALVVAVLAVGMAQHVSAEDHSLATNAQHTGAEPVALLDAIHAVSRQRPATELVVLSDDPSLFAYRPYWAFQAPAAAYASPTGTFQARNEAIRHWAQAEDSAALLAAWDADGFTGPDVLVLTQRDKGADAGAPPVPGPAGPDTRWVFHEIVNTMPRASNILRVPVEFDPALFDPAHFVVEQVGGMVVIGRKTAG